MTAHADEMTALAGHGSRIGAALLDAVFSAIVVAACGAAGFGTGLLLSGGSDTSDGWEVLGWIFFGSLVGLLVGAVSWIVLTIWLVQRPGPRNGQTLGKQIFSIRAARRDQAAIGVGTALLREVLAKGVLAWIAASIVSALFGFADGGFVGLVVALVVVYGPAFVDDERRALHDRLCSTRVIDAGKAPAAPPVAPPDDLWPATR